MDVPGEKGSAQPGAGRGSRSANGNGALTREQIGAALGRWQPAELRIARAFAECRGLSSEQLEDLYQDTVLALLARPYDTEAHLRNALRTGIKHRALNLHRDQRRRAEILAHSAPSLHRIAQERAKDNGPEDAALAQADKLIVSEFLAELTELERRVFWLLADGLRYRAIAPVLGVATNEARNSARACERKRERFQLLYDTGRLCGFRAATIQALQSGQATSAQLATRAFAHLEACAHCRAEHKTNARRLRRSFQGHAAALLPLPALVANWGWLQRLGARARGLQERWAAAGLPPGQGGAREGAIGVVLGGGAAAKLAAGVATVAVIAGSTIGAGDLAHHPRRGHRHRDPSTVAVTRPRVKPPVAQATASSTPTRRVRAGAPRFVASAPQQFGPGHVVALAAVSQPRATNARYANAGFAYLGAPTRAAASAGASVRVHAASASAGGAFSP